MQNITFRYTRWINSRQKRTGPLFHGRFKAVIVDRDAYLVDLVRYIHLNQPGPDSGSTRRVTDGAANRRIAVWRKSTG